MPPNIVRGRPLSDIILPVFQVQDEDKVYSPENFINGIADVYGSQHVILYGSNGEKLLSDDYGQLQVTAPVRDPGVPLFEKAVCGSTPANTTQVSDFVGTNEYRKFSLFMNIDSTGAPTRLDVYVQFLDPIHLHPHNYTQGPFASLSWEDVDTANGLYECLAGDIVSQLIGLKIVCVGGAVGAYFTVTASMEFWG